METTIATIETKRNTFFIDFDESLTDLKPFKVFQFEKFKGAFKTKTEALDFILSETDKELKQKGSLTISIK